MGGAFLFNGFFWYRKSLGGLTYRPMRTVEVESGVFFTVASVCKTFGLPSMITIFALTTVTPSTWTTRLKKDRFSRPGMI
jgi:hypothetical protein